VTAGPNPTSALIFSGPLPRRGIPKPRHRNRSG
jgi:hypothetical protein